MSARILVADDDALLRAAVAKTVRALGHVVVEAASGPEAAARACADPVDLVLLDLEMPHGGGLEALPSLLAAPRSPSVVIVTGHGDVPTAVEALRAGACDFLEKPLDPRALEAAISRALSARSVPTSANSSPILGTSTAIRRVREAIERIAQAPRTTVLVSGESGVGKELVTREIHDRSARASGPFVAVNCAALAPQLLESELFGYVSGAFTGAQAGGRDGLFAVCAGGTLFLDEIGDLELGLQSKLLRVLQERSYRPIGAHNDVATDVRIVAATNRDLSERVGAGHFREDLYYRLNVLSVHVPPLRERREDIATLSAHLIREARVRTGCAGGGVSKAALERLEAHTWPGNVRELENTLERAVLEARGRAIEPGDLSIATSLPGMSRNATVDGLVLPVTDRSLKNVERALIERVLVETGNNRTRAARLLGINRATLYHKLDAYGLASGKETPGSR